MQSQSFQPEAVQKAHERLYLHELIRIGVGRQEDLKLLHSVAIQDASLPAAACQQLLKECHLREEWRLTRETQLLERVRESNLVTFSHVDDQQLTDQLIALQQIREEERQLLARQARHSAAGTNRSAGAGPRRQPPSPILRSTSLSGSSSSPHGMSASSMAAALQLYGGAAAAAAAAPSSGGRHTRPLSASRQLPQGSPGKPATPPKPRAPSPYAAGARRPSTSSAAPHLPSISPRPSSATQAPGRPGTAPTTSVPISPELPAGSAAGGTDSVLSRFQQLYRLQGVLLQGLQQHASAGGAEGATSALEINIRQAQETFAACMAEAQELLMAQRGRAARQGPSWDKLLQLGQLGLTSADVARLQHLRRQAAARVVQRAVRRFLRILRHQRALEAARQRAAAVQQKLRERAAIVIQRMWRGLLGRRRAAAHKQQVLRVRQVARMERLKRELAVQRIQRAYRAYKRRQRVRVAMGLVPLANSSSSAPAAATKAGPGPGRATGKSSQAATAQAVAATAAAATARVERLQSDMRCWSADKLAAAVRSAVLIQAAVRGWLVRRGLGLWWRRQLAGLRGRRAVVRTWQHHQAYMQATYGLQQQLVGLLLQEAELGATAAAEAARERREFEGSWSRWMDSQIQLAMTQPLPRGWITQLDPTTGLTNFVNTRTGEIHAYHPAMHDLRAFVAEQRQVAEAQLAEREGRVAQRMGEVRAASLRSQSHLLEAMQQAAGQAQSRDLHGHEQAVHGANVHMVAEEHLPKKVPAAQEINCC